MKTVSQTLKALIFCLILLSCQLVLAQTQIGADIDGEAFSDYSGRSVSMNADGTIVAIGAANNNGNGSNSGHVRVYENIGGAWTQVGNDIDGESGGDGSGWSVSINDAGTIVAIGARYNDGNGADSGHVRVYQNIGGTWTQIGSDIDGEAAEDLSGFSVSLNADGTIVAIGATGNIGLDTDGFDNGHVRVYQNLAGTWTQVGGDIDGGTGNRAFGSAVSLSADGSIVAIGDNSYFGSSRGQVQIYQNLAGTWTQIGSKTGAFNGDRFGDSVSINNSGTMVAVGASGHANSSGHVRVFQNLAGTWTKIGDDIDGEANFDLSGSSVSLSADGNIVAIGAPQNDGNGSNSGHVRIYQNVAGVWTQVGVDIDGEGNTNYSGTSVCLNADGSTVSIGAIANGSFRGHVRVYDTGVVPIVDNDNDGFTSDVDCNDNDDTVYPSAPEICDTLDNDCDGLTDDADPDITGQTTWYADTDADGFGDPDSSVLACFQPADYVADNTDCDDTDDQIHPNTVWYADTDSDGYGDATDSVIACEQPLNYVLDDSDCDDTISNLNPNNPALQFGGSTNYTSALVYPLSGSTDTGYTFEVEYIDEGNNLPPATFPRLLLDFEGNGSLNNPNDLTLIMTEVDLNDTNTSDGKRYTVSVPALPAGTDWESSVQVINGSCTATIGPFNYPDVFVLPDLQIFANDITFSNINPDVSSEITVFATIHNISDFDANNFDVELKNQADLGTVYPNINVPVLPANSTEMVSWTITTPPTEGWNPMQVSVDINNVISETLEINNSAVRPFTNGDFNVPGDIVLTANASPNTTFNNSGNTVSICGNAEYIDTAIPLADPSVAGATITIEVLETGATYTTYTNANGNYCFNVPVPLQVGIYTAEVSVTDFTLTTTETTSFNIVEAPVLPDLETTVLVNETNIFEGNPVSGTIKVENIGLAATTITSLLDISNVGGTPVISDEVIPILNPGDVFTTTFSGIIYSGTGTFSICAHADALLEIDESTDNNNYDCFSVSVISNLPNLRGRSGPSGNPCIDNAPTSVTFGIENANTVATGAFTTIVNVYLDGGLIQTITENIATVAAGATYSFTEPFTYSSPGAYEFEMIIDSNDDITEFDEDNNTIIFNQDISTCLPNLTLNPNNCEDDRFDVSVDPVFPGTATYSVQMYNTGEGTATGPFDIDFVFSGGQVLSTTYNGILSPGTNTVVSVDGPTVESGTETLEVNIDSNSEVTESNETDNSAIGDLCWDFSFNKTRCSSSNFWQENQPINQPVYFSIGVDLSGLYDASTVDVLFEVSGPEISGSINAGTATITDLESNCFCPYRADLAVPFVFSQSGTFTVTMTVDPMNVYDECDEGNNVTTVDVNVVDLPDLRILSQYIDPSDLNPNIGEDIMFDITYENIAASNPGDVMDLCVYADGVLVETIHDVSGLLSGTNTTVPVSSPYSSLIAGAHIISAEIDCADEINEATNINNVATRAIVVGDAGNLIFTSLTASDLSPNLSDIVDITAIIENEGNATINGDVRFYYTDNLLNELQIAGPYSISLDEGQNTTIQFPWNVLDNMTTIVAIIDNASPVEYNNEDNEANLQLGGLDVSMDAIPSCADLDNGSLTANVTGGTPPYSYVWSNGTLQNSTIDGPGMYTLTITDNTGFSITVEGEILHSAADYNDNGIIDCEEGLVVYVYDNGWLPSDPTGISTTDDDIIIQAGSVDMTGDTNCRSFTVRPGAGVTIVSGASVTSTECFLLESTSTNYSSLILDGIVTNNLCYQRHVNANGSGVTGDNDLVSAPLTGQPFNSFAAANPNIFNNGSLYLFGPFYKPNGSFITWSGTETTTLNAGIGYRAATSDNSTVTFTGIAENTEISVPLENSGTNYQRWNLVGNPYPSYLNVLNFLIHDTGEGIRNIDLFVPGTAAIYGYDGSAINGWTIYNLANTTLSTLIAPGQGFFVSAMTSSTLEFTPDMRTIGTGDDFIIGRTSGLEYFKLKLVKNNDTSQTEFYFNDNASLGFDFGYDAEIFIDSGLSLYSHLVEDNEGIAIALQTLNTSDMSNVTIPLGVHADQGEQISFSISESTIPDSVNVYLDDRETHNSTLLNSRDYRLTPRTNVSGTGRFFLRLTKVAGPLDETHTNDVHIYAINNTREIVVEGHLFENSFLEVFDIQGRKVLDLMLDAAFQEIRLDASCLDSGVYMVRVRNSSLNKTQKVILN